MGWLVKSLTALSELIQNKRLFVTLVSSAKMSQRIKMPIGW